MSCKVRIFSEVKIPYRDVNVATMEKCSVIELDLLDSLRYIIIEQTPYESDPAESLEE